MQEVRQWLGIGRPAAEREMADPLKIFFEKPVLFAAGRPGGKIVVVADSRSRPQPLNSLCDRL